MLSTGEPFSSVIRHQTLCRQAGSSRRYPPELSRVWPGRAANRASLPACGTGFQPDRRAQAWGRHSGESLMVGVLPARVTGVALVAHRMVLVAGWRRAKLCDSVTFCIVQPIYLCRARLYMASEVSSHVILSPAKNPSLIFRSVGWRCRCGPLLCRPSGAVGIMAHRNPTAGAT